MTDIVWLYSNPLFQLSPEPVLHELLAFEEEKRKYMEAINSSSYPFTYRILTGISRNDFLSLIHPTAIVSLTTPTLTHSSTTDSLTGFNSPKSPTSPPPQQQPTTTTTTTQTKKIPRVKISPNIIHLSCHGLQNINNGNNNNTNNNHPFQLDPDARLSFESHDSERFYIDTKLRLDVIRQICSHAKDKGLFNPNESHPWLRLLVLASCHSYQVAELMSTELNIPYCICSQYELRDDLSIQFLHQFYQLLFSKPYCLIGDIPQLFKRAQELMPYAGEGFTLWVHPQFALQTNHLPLFSSSALSKLQHNDNNNNNNNNNHDITKPIQLPPFELRIPSHLSPYRMNETHVRVEALLGRIFTQLHSKSSSSKLQNNRNNSKLLLITNEIDKSLQQQIYDQQLQQQQQSDSLQTTPNNPTLFQRRDSNHSFQDLPFLTRTNTAHSQQSQQSIQTSTYPISSFGKKTLVQHYITYVLPRFRSKFAAVMHFFPTEDTFEVITDLKIHTTSSSLTKSTSNQSITTFLLSTLTQLKLEIKELNEQGVLHDFFSYNLYDDGQLPSKILLFIPDFNLITNPFHRYELWKIFETEQYHDILEDVYIFITTEQPYDCSPYAITTNVPQTTTLSTPLSPTSLPRYPSPHWSVLHLEMLNLKEKAFFFTQQCFKLIFERTDDLIYLIRAYNTALLQTLQSSSSSTTTATTTSSIASSSATSATSTTKPVKKVLFPPIPLNQLHNVRSGHSARFEYEKSTTTTTISSTTATSTSTTELTISNNTTIPKVNLNEEEHNHHHHHEHNNTDPNHNYQLTVDLVQSLCQLNDPTMYRIFLSAVESTGLLHNTISSTPPFLQYYFQLYNENSNLSIEQLFSLLHTLPKDLTLDSLQLQLPILPPQQIIQYDIPHMIVQHKIISSSIIPSSSPIEPHEIVATANISLDDDDSELDFDFLNNGLSNNDQEIINNNNNNNGNENQTQNIDDTIHSQLRPILYPNTTTIFPGSSHIIPLIPDNDNTLHFEKTRPPVGQRPKLIKFQIDAPIIPPPKPMPFFIPPPAPTPTITPQKQQEQEQQQSKEELKPISTDIPSPTPYIPSPTPYIPVPIPCMMPVPCMMPPPGPTPIGPSPGGGGFIPAPSPTPTPQPVPTITPTADEVQYDIDDDELQTTTTTTTTTTGDHTTKKGSGAIGGIMTSKGGLSRPLKPSTLVDNTITSDSDQQRDRRRTERASSSSSSPMATTSPRRQFSTTTTTTTTSSTTTDSSADGDDQFVAPPQVEFAITSDPQQQQVDIEPPQTELNERRFHQAPAKKGFFSNFISLFQGKKHSKRENIAESQTYEDVAPPMAEISPKRNVEQDEKQKQRKKLAAEDENIQSSPSPSPGTIMMHTPCPAPPPPQQEQQPQQQQLQQQQLQQQTPSTAPITTTTTTTSTDAKELSNQSYSITGVQNDQAKIDMLKANQALEMRHKNQQQETKELEKSKRTFGKKMDSQSISSSSSTTKTTTTAAPATTTSPPQDDDGVFGGSDVYGGSDDVYRGSDDINTTNDTQNIDLLFGHTSFLQTRITFEEAEDEVMFQYTGGEDEDDNNNFVEQDDDNICIIDGDVHNVHDEDDEDDDEVEILFVEDCDPYTTSLKSDSLDQQLLDITTQSLDIPTDNNFKQFFGKFRY